MQVAELLFDLFRPLQQLDRVDLEGGCQLVQDIDAGSVPFSFEQADVIAVDAGEIGERLLSEPAFLPEPSQVLREDPPKFHAVEGTAWATSAPPSILVFRLL